MIDDGNDRQWPEEITKLARFRQGTLVARPPFFYYASTALPIWEASKLLAGDHEGELVVELQPDDRTEFGIVTSQTCDVYAVGDTGKPWVQLAPVYQLAADNNRLPDVIRARVYYLAPVRALGERWVADLRIEFPVEKGWLALQEPIAGFNDQAGYDEFGLMCGRYRTRPGIADAIYTDVIDVLREWLETLRKNERPLYEALATGIKRLFIDIRGDHLTPEAIQLIFVSESTLGPELASRLERWWEETYVGKALPFTTLAPRLLTYSQVSFAEHIHWVEVDLSRLTSN